MNRKFGLMGLAMAALCAVLVLFPWAGSAEASEPIDTTASASLTLTYKYGTMTLADVPVHLYCVADASVQGAYMPSGDFSSYPVVITPASEEDVTAETLSDYATADGIKAFRDTTTGDEGIASFTSLPTGVYLVVADRTTVGDSTYEFSPFLVSLPDLDTSGKWVYDVSANPKGQKITPMSENRSYKVVKHWSDEGYETARPASITIEIFKDGVSSSTQVLDSSNNWSYSWEAADDDSAWVVVERDVPNDYTVTMTSSASGTATTFIATNTHAPSATPSTPTTATSTTTAPTATASATSTTSAANEIAVAPKTGDSTLWQPILILAFAGMVLLVVGWRMGALSGKTKVSQDIADQVDRKGSDPTHGGEEE